MKKLLIWLAALPLAAVFAMLRFVWLDHSQAILIGTLLAMGALLAWRLIAKDKAGAAAAASVALLCFAYAAGGPWGFEEERLLRGLVPQSATLVAAEHHGTFHWCFDLCPNAKAWFTSDKSTAQTRDEVVDTIMQDGWTQNSPSSACSNGCALQFEKRVSGVLLHLDARFGANVGSPRIDGRMSNWPAGTPVEIFVE